MSKKTKRIIMVLLITFEISLLVATFIGMITNSPSLSKLDFILVAIIFIAISAFCKIYK